MQTIRDYAKNNGVSYEAIRKQIKTYEAELKGHIVKNGRTQYLDDDAVAFLDARRSQNSVIVERVEQSELIEELKNENKQLLIKIASLQEQLLQEKDTVKQLQQEKIELLEDKNSKQKKRFFWQK